MTKYNPYEDSTLHTTKSEENQDHSEREGFNDVLKHYDAVNGFQNPKRMEHIPKLLRRIIRWVILLHVVCFLVLFIYHFVETLRGM